MQLLGGSGLERDNQPLALMTLLELAQHRTIHRRIARAGVTLTLQILGLLLVLKSAQHLLGFGLNRC